MSPKTLHKVGGYSQKLDAINRLGAEGGPAIWQFPDALAG